MKNLDWKATEKRARSMTDEGLIWSRVDCNEAATAADALERAGCSVSKSGGYYRDEAGVYAAELAGRRAKAARS